jgi:hypothetical protein
MAELPTTTLRVASVEQKAWRTLSATGAQVAPDARFNEVHRLGEPCDGDYQRLRTSVCRRRDDIRLGDAWHDDDGMAGEPRRGG